MTHQSAKKAQFSETFFDYDVSKYRTKTAVPLNQQGIWEKFSDYQEPEFWEIGKFDTIFSHLCEIDRDLAEDFVDDAKAELDSLFDEIKVRVQHLVARYTDQYAHDQAYVFKRLRALEHRSKRRIAAK